MAKFRVVTPKGASFTVAGGGYGYEKEALDPIGAEIIEAPANEADFIEAARTADAIYAKGIPISSGVYISHVEVPGAGEKIVKFFGGMRQIDLENI